MTTLSNKLPSRLFLFIFIVAFVVLKLPALHVAYYWDECWPYATAIKNMHDHGISLLPTAMNPELSRGHPLLFHALGASWMHVFGGSHVSMHSFALLISVLLLVLVYETALTLFSMRAAILAISLVGVQQMFFVQSAMLLFDMLVALLSFASIVFYVRERYLLAGLCLAMAFFTKESGLIAGFVIGIDAWIKVFDSKILWRTRITKLLTVAVPSILIGMFFLLQKHARGWYVFPMYSDMIEADWGKFWYSFRMCIVSAAFYSQFHWCYLLLLPLFATVAAIKQRSLRPLIILLPAICIYFMVDDQRSLTFLPPIPCFMLFVASFVLSIYMYANKTWLPQLQQRHLVRLTGMFILCFLIYSNLSYFSARYLLVAVIPVLFLAAVFIDELSNLSYKWLFYPALAAIAVITVFTYRLPKSGSDVSMGAFDGIAVHQGVVDYFEQQKVYGKKIATNSFLQSVHLTDPGTGFLHGSDTFNATTTFTPDIDYAIFDNLEPDGKHPQFQKDTAFKRVYRIQKDWAWAEIYRRR